MALARRFVREALSGTDEDLIDSAELLTSELVTNAVLHASGDVQVRVWATAERVHVRVFDRTTTRSPVVRPRDPDATTGRGLQLVEMLASTYGIDRGPEGKTVWFEVWAVGAPEIEHGDWAGQLQGDTGETRPVILDGLPTGLFRAGQRHRDALLRECMLQALASGDVLGVTPETLVRASAVSDLIASRVGQELDVAGDAAIHTVAVDVPVGWAEAAALLAQVLEAANAAAREGSFLTRPALPEIRMFRTWLLEQIAGQLDGATPRSWAAYRRDHDDEATAFGATGWEPVDVDHTDVATITADENNVITAVNAAAAELLGWQPHELVGKRVIAVIPPDWRDRHVAGFTSFLLTGESSLIGNPVTVPALHAANHTIDVSLLLQVTQGRSGRTIFVAQLRPADAALAS